VKLMSKAKVPPIATARQDEPRTVPLSDITITWPPLRDFDGEPETPITLSGKRLGAIVAWMARTTPGHLRGEGDPWYADGVRFDLQGLAEILRGLGAADLDMASVNTSAIFPLLATMATDLAGRLAAEDDVETDFKAAIVTIGAQAAEAK
jgi:hypothetical protein